MIYSNKARMAMFFAGTVLCSTAANAVQDVTELGFYATAAASYASDDNIFRQANSAINDTVVTVSPELLFIKKFGKHQVTAEYFGDFATYTTNSTEDYTDSSVSVDGLLDLTPSFNVDVQAGYNAGHEARVDSGAGVADSKVNTFTEDTVFAGLTYGRDISKAQVELDYSTDSIAYTNNSQEIRDRSGNSIAARIFYNFAKTKVFVEVKQNTVDYVTKDLDGAESFYHAGVRWDASYKTTGELKVGKFEKTFDSSARTTGTGTSYEANILWSPKDYSHVTLGLSQSPQESITDTSDYYTSSVISADWEHDFSSKLGLNLGVSSITDDYSDSQKDITSTASVGLNYSFRKSIDFAFNYTQSTRDSNDDTLDYTDNLFLLTAKLSSAR